MTKYEIKLASALSLIVSITCAGPLYASSLSTYHHLSDNCAEAAKHSDSLIRSVAAILCDREKADRLAFGSFIEREKPSDPGEQERPTSPFVSTPSTAPKPGVRVTKDKLHNQVPGHFPAHDKPHSQQPGNGKADDRPRHHAKTGKAKVVTKDKTAKHHHRAGDRRNSKRGPVQKGKEKYAHGVPRPARNIESLLTRRPLEQLSRAERKVLVRNLEFILTRKVSIAFLNTIQHFEGGRLLEVVGGTRGKSLDCLRRINRLNASGHPKQQGLPDRCFLTTRKYGLSTAAGLYQIVYYRNWKRLRNPLQLRNFLDKHQGIAALELVRTSAVRDGRVGEGLVALAKGDLSEAIRKGTDPWASSPYSRWRGKSTGDWLQYARKELKRLNNQRYAQSEFKRFARDTNS